MKKKNLVSFVSDKYLIIAIILLGTMLMIPIGMTFFYSLLKTELFTPDGILSYIGVIVTNTISLLSCLIAIHQSQRSADLQEEMFIQQRKNEIFPHIVVKLEYSNENDEYTISLINMGKYPAIGITLGTEKITDRLVQERAFTKKISVEELQVFTYPTSTKNNDWVDEIYPKILEIYCCDIDGNDIVQIYRYTSDMGYQFWKSE